MRVIAGTLGGRRLRAPAGRGTRPTGERVREALFSILGDLTDLRVLDLFAGSGALGIEALSRGAASAVFVERDTRALAALEGNLADLGLGRERAIVRRDGALAVLGRARAAGDAYDLVLIDPPYQQATDWGNELTRELPALLAHGARVVTESDRRAPLQLALELVSERRYGDTLIRIHTHTIAPGGPA